MIGMIGVLMFIFGFGFSILIVVGEPIGAIGALVGIIGLMIMSANHM